MTPAPLHAGQAPSELALNSAGFTPLAFAKTVRIGSRSPGYVAGLLRRGPGMGWSGPVYGAGLFLREPRIGVWSTDTTPVPAGMDATRELFPEPATPVR